jgi:signal transduction histidine kinase
VSTVRGSDAPAATLAALPFALWIFDADDRLAFANAVARDVGAPLSAPLAAPLGVPLPGTPLAEVLRHAAERGALGPGDPEELTRHHLGLDRRRPHRCLLRRVDGSRHEVHLLPLPGGGFGCLDLDVTAYYDAAAEATRRARLLETAVARIHGGLLLFDADRGLMVANPGAEDLLGLPRGALRPGIAHAAIQQELIARDAFSGNELDSCAAQDRARQSLYALERRDGTVLRVASQPMPDGGYLMELDDVTALTRARQEARARAAVLDGVLSALPVGVVVVGPDGRVAVVNAAYNAIMTGATVAVGADWPTLIRRRAVAGEYGPGGPEALAREQLEGLDGRQRRRPNGTVLDLRYAALPDGGFVKVVTDITALKEAEAQATERAATVQAMLDHMRHGIALYGPDRRLVAANALAADLCGLSPAEMVPGQSMDDLLRLQAARGSLGPDGAAVAERLAALDRTRPTRGQRVLPDGRIIDIASDMTPDGGFVITWTDVTARARAEQEAEARAATLRTTLDNVRHGIAMFSGGPEPRLVAANRLAGPEFGLPPLIERIGERFEDLVREQLRAGSFGSGEAAAGIAAEVLALDRSLSHRYVRHLPWGKVIEIESHRTPDGGFLLTQTDVTDLVQAQAAAAERAATLQIMLDNMRHGISYFGRDRRLIAANQLGEEFGGIHRGGVTPGRSIDELIKEQIARGAFGADSDGIGRMVAALDRARPHRYVRPTWDGRMVEVTSDPTPDGGFVVTSTDVTALAEAEAEAKRRAAIQQVMLDNIRHGICLVDAAGQVVAANPIYRAFLSLPEELLAGGCTYRGIIAFLEARGDFGPGEEGAAVARRILDADRSRSWRHVRTTLEGRVLEGVSDPTPDGGFVVTLSDVTEDRHVRAELERAKEAAEAANSAKSRFLATMSHELRTPLNAVIGFSEALVAGARPQSAGEYARAILEAGRHLLSLIDDILDATRAETGGIAVTEERVDLLALARSILRVMQAEAEANGVTLLADLPERLPALRGDERRLRQVLINLLSNAVKFTLPGGTVTLSAALEPAEGGEALVLRVADTGIGMRTEDIPRAFEPFTQVDASFARRFPGAGLGLYLARAMVAAQGATLTLESAPALGTTAVLRFPPERLLPGA